MKKIFTTALLLGILPAAFAQETIVIVPKKVGKIKQMYWAAEMDGSILSSSILEKNGSSNITVPRYTCFWHVGTTAHYNFNSSFGLISGIGLKNIGFIEKYNNPDSTVKRRNYVVGIPLAIKVGDMFGTYAMIGGGVDIPIWFKEKGFVKRNDKVKINEWFSQRTAPILPYVFVGARFDPGVFVKATYYPTNFMNPDYEQTISGVTVKPYNTYNVNLFMLSLGFDITYRPRYE